MYTYSPSFSTLTYCPARNTLFRACIIITRSWIKLEGGRKGDRSLCEARQSLFLSDLLGQLIAL